MVSKYFALSYLRKALGRKRCYSFVFDCSSQPNLERHSFGNKLNKFKFGLTKKLDRSVTRTTAVAALKYLQLLCIFLYTLTSALITSNLSPLPCIPNLESVD